jgi:hypothetical protein
MHFILNRLHVFLDDANLAQVVLNTLFASNALSPQFLSKRMTTE